MSTDFESLDGVLHDALIDPLAISFQGDGVAVDGTREELSRNSNDRQLYGAFPFKLVIRPATLACVEDPALIGPAAIMSIVHDPSAQTLSLLWVTEAKALIQLTDGSYYDLDRSETPVAVKRWFRWRPTGAQVEGENINPLFCFVGEDLLWFRWPGEAADWVERHGVVDMDRCFDSRGLAVSFRTTKRARRHQTVVVVKGASIAGEVAPRLAGLIEAVHPGEGEGKSFDELIRFVTGNFPSNA